MSRVPLSDQAVLEQVQLMSHIPHSLQMPDDDKVCRFLESMRKSTTANAALALWPDGTWALLAYNPDWRDPRPEQLLRAYRAAYRAGSRRAAAWIGS